jgi:L-threonylcarbamoyladenylate synthase
VTEVIQVNTAQAFNLAVEAASQLLSAGHVVALPTETVYGLAANALHPKAIEKIFRIKGRPAHNPVIVHVSSIKMARECANSWPTSAQKLADAFWPGPLTLVLPKSPTIPDPITAGGNTVGLRWPSHPLMQAVIQKCGFPLAAPSANLSTQTSPTQATHVIQSLNGKIPLVVDAGPCNVGIESTVIDLTVSPPQILRPGMIHAEAIKTVLGELPTPNPTQTSETARSPGLMDRHYAPSSPILLASWKDEPDLLQQIHHSLPTRTSTPPHQPLPPTCVICHNHPPSPKQFARVSIIPHDPEAYARAIYGELHACDSLHPALIVIENVPNTPPWLGIADRLRRAATPPAPNP